MAENPVSSWVEHRADAGIFLDFDGTLSEIVERPEDAQPVEGVVEVLEELDAACRLVAVVSGRSAHQLVERLGPRIEIWGLHGAERAVGGRVEVAARAAPYEGLMREIEATARTELEGSGLLVEDKGVMVGLHYRTAPNRAAAESAALVFSERMAAERGTRLGRGRFVIEIRPPVEFSKEAVVAARAREESLAAVAFAGDDVVDLPAFDALDSLAQDGVACVRIAVASHEGPMEIVERADVVVEDGPRGLVRLLRQMAG